MSPFVPLVCALLAQAPAATTPLTGTVVGHDGKPAAGAVVVLTAVPNFGRLRIAAETKAGDDGTFRLERPSKLAGENSWLSPALWAARPGSRAALVRYPGDLPGAGEPVTLKLGPPESVPVRVVGPDGKPVPGARVRVTDVTVDLDRLELPDRVAEATEVAAGDDGVAALAAFPKNELSRVEARAPKFGNQPREIGGRGGFPNEITLRPVGSVVGRFVSDTPVDYSKWGITAYTQPDDAPNPSGRPTGLAFSKIDAEGRYAFPELAAGRLDVHVDWPDDATVIPAFPAMPAVRAGRETTADLPLKRASKIVGRVVERGTGTPIENVRVTVHRPTEGPNVFARTGADGRFWFVSLPGTAMFDLARVPDGYVKGGWHRVEKVRVPEPPGQLDLGAIEVDRAAPPLRGVARDANGRAIEGVKLSANYILSRNGKNDDWRSDLITDDQGGFELNALLPGTKVTIAAKKGEWVTDDASSADVTERELPPLALVVRRRPTVSVAGRVVGLRGGPVEGASVMVSSTTFEDGNPREPRHEPFAASLRTGPDGTFRSPKDLASENVWFRVHVTADGYTPLESPWAKAGGGPTVTFPDVRLFKVRGARSVAGRVVDDDGEPVRGAQVFQAGNGPRRSQVVPDAEGAFRLANVPEGVALVFARAPGYRFGGAVVPAEPGSGGVTIRLTREGRPGPRPPAAEPAAVMSRAEERALARSLLEPVLADRAALPPPTGDEAVEILARVDPERALAVVEDRALAGSSHRQAVRQAVLGLAEDRPDEAVAVVESDRNPGSRATLYLALADAAPETDLPRKVDLLDRALADARLERPGGPKLQTLGRIGLGLLAAGETVLGTGVLREGDGEVAAMAPASWSFGVEEFGMALAVVDPIAAEAIFERKRFPNVSRSDPSTLRRHWVRVAGRVAGRDPDFAERILREPSPAPAVVEQTRAVLLAVSAIAATDAPHARRLLDVLRNGNRAGPAVDNALPFYGLGLIARAQARQNPALALVLLDEAFEGLSKVPANRQNLRASCVMAGLLPTVAEVDPGRVVERAWLAASCRAAWSGDADPDAVGESAALALLLRPYDRALADAVFAPVAAMLPVVASVTSRAASAGRSPMFKAFAAYDPRGLRAALDSLAAVDRRDAREPVGTPTASVEDRFRLAAAEALGFPPERRVPEVLRRYFHGYGLWPLDDRDD